MTIPAGQHSATNGDLAPEQLLTHPAMWRRFAMLSLVCVVALPVVPLAMCVTWLGLYALIFLAELALIRRRGYIPSDLPGMAVNFATSCLLAWATYELIVRGDPGARLFAGALIGFSAVQILLRFYASPLLFAAAIFPHAVAVSLASFNLAAAYFAAEDYLKALTPIAALLTYVVVLAPARRRLAGAWSRLVAAKRAAEAASRTKSEFLATMSHEIRTPLNGILGMAQAMQHDALSPAQRERLCVISRSGEGLLELLNDTLDFSQIEGGRLAISVAEFDVEQVTRGAVAVFTPIAAQKGLALEFSIDEAAKGRFLGDPVRLRQILYNLAFNAVKFTDQGRIAVCVSHADNALWIEVADSGVGIPADRIGGIFDPFVQADSSATRRHSGVGLGLAICRSLAELMGGRITVSSVEGKGSIFTITLPMPRAAQPAPIAAVETAAAAHEAALSVRILAAEDNPVNQLVLKTLLSQAGLEPTVVENGAEAIAAWKTGAWDLILMDIQMPVMDGVTAAREIRACEAAGGRQKTPIIAVTANAMSHQVTDYLAAGMDMVVPKPLEAAKLFEAIERALDGCDAPPTAAAA